MAQRFAAIDIEAMLSLHRESPGVEYKASGTRTDAVYFSKIIKTMIAMANRADGGVILVGVAEANGSLNVTGVDSKTADTWGYDDFASGVGPFVDPMIEFDAYLVEVRGQEVLVIKVEEFAQVPIVCRKAGAADTSGRSNLKNGAIYIRPSGKPETREIMTATEMRALLDLATAKAVRRFLETASEVGLDLRTAMGRSHRSKQQYDQEGGGF